MRLLKEAPVLAEEGDIWREVLNLAAGVLVYNNNNFEQVLFAVERMVPHSIPAAKESAVWYRIWLAGEMAAVVGRQNFEESDFADELLPLLKEQFVALLQNEALTPQQRAEAGDALGQLGDPRPGVCTLEPDLIEIPAGDFLSGDEIETHSIERPFAIARYPVTVAQFAMFVEDGGYEKTRYWVGKESAGWSWRQSEHPNYRGEGSVTEPRYWRHTRWHEENRPVVGVSWYEAQAYCAWLAEKSGREYRLPAAVEWERAARSTDGREYAWGNEWEDGIINSREAQINRTTAVGAFPRGAAECGADDMGGNVLEWMAYFSYSDPNSSLVRGGSWLYTREYARVVFLGNNKRDLSYFNVGFRLVSPVS
jgi:formylglycine-generating enzyme required for sulfatase activity